MSLLTAPLVASAVTVALGLGGARDGKLYVPRGYRADRPAPLLILLHGAGARGAQMIELAQPLADAHGVVVLAPDSRGSSWDFAADGRDATFVRRAIDAVAARWPIDRSRVAVGGFSDGASQALTLGVADGERFGAVLAFSPGFVGDAAAHGRARIFVAHGTRDAVLPINACSRRLVPYLRGAGYDVRYDEFDGPHAVPGAIARAAFEWWLGPAAQRGGAAAAGGG